MTDEPVESDLRRRAAWLLALLVVAAVLVVVVVIALLGSSGGSPKHPGLAGPDDRLSTPANTSTHHTAPPRTRTPTGAAPSVRDPGGPSTTTCPSTAMCVLQGDAAQAIAAINAFRQDHGRRAVPGTVSAAAQKCALSDGGQCSGGWAETYLDRLDGPAAVKKIAALGKLLDPQMTSFGIGWAYKPAARTYYLAIVRANG